MGPESLAVRLARLEERSDAILTQVKQFGPVAGQLIEAVAELHSLKEDIAELRLDVRANTTTLSSVTARQTQQDAVLSNRQKWTYGLATLLIGSALGILAKLAGL